MSKTWLLSWNPKNWNWEKYSEWCTGTKAGNCYKESWTCHSKKPSIGDEFFLLKTGIQPRGIIGHGHIARESYDAPHYNAERASKGEVTNHIDASFDRLLNYENDPILLQDDLKERFPEQQWSPQGSGIQIRPEVVPLLTKLWEETITRSTTERN